MNSGIPFIKNADRIEVNVEIFAKRTIGPPVDSKKQVHGSTTTI
jgi:hypothetical protein